MNPDPTNPGVRIHFQNGGVLAGKQYGVLAMEGSGIGGEQWRENGMLHEHAVMKVGVVHGRVRRFECHVWSRV